MHDPSMADALGLKVASLVAGFFGGVISLSFLRDLTPFQGFLAVFTGTFSAGYLTPVVLPYVGTTLPESSIAFVVGITAMNVIPGFIKLSEVFRRNPGAILNRTGDGK